MKFRVTRDLDYIMGHLRYGHLEGIVEANSEDELKEMMEQKHFDYTLNVVVDSYRIEDWEASGNYEWEEISDD